MKKLVLILFLLIQGICFSQDNGYDTILPYSSLIKNEPIITFAPPSNDNICGALTISNTDCYPRVPANWTAINHSTATWEAAYGTPACWGVFYGATLWYKFVATTTAQLITTDWYYGGATGNIDNQLAIYKSSNNLCTGALTRIGCSEDIHYTGTQYGNAIIYNPDYFSNVTVTGLTPGNTYFIRVDGQYQYDACPPSGCWSFAPGWSLLCTQPAAVNDACLTALPVVINTIYPTSSEAACAISNNDVSDLAFTCGSTENMIFYTFTAPATDTYYINQWGQSCNQNRGTQFIIYKSAYNCSTLPSAMGSPNAVYELYCSGQSTADRNFSINLVSGQTYYIVIDGGRGDECTFNWEITQGAPLPVELLYLSGAPYNDKITITWATASEFNNDYFTIEKSIDGKIFKKIGTVNGDGTTSLLSNYTFNDLEPVSGINYYRLSQKDYNGATKSFDIINISYNKGLVIDKKIIYTMSGQQINTLEENLLPGLYIKYIYYSNKTYQVSKIVK